MSQNLAKRLCPNYRPEKVTYLGQTYFEPKTFSFLWTVSNFSALLPNLDDEELTSPVFQGGGPDPKTNHSWQLSMFEYEDEDDEDRPDAEKSGVAFLNLRLNLIDYGVGYEPDSQGRRIVRPYFKFSILNVSGQPAVQTDIKTENLIISEEHEYFNSGGERKVISMAELVDPARQLVVNDSLKILCEVWLKGDLKHKLGDVNGTPSEEERQRVWKDKLAIDVENLYKQSIGTDVTVSVGSSSLKAHKAILTARSPVFAAMFNNASNMLEAETATVTISDFDEEVVKGMLQHLYTGNADCIAERAPELLQIADKYDLSELKRHCEYVIAKSLGNDNVVEILILADKHSASFLKSRAVDFININKRELSQMESFQAAVKANTAGSVFGELFLLQK